MSDFNLRNPVELGFIQTKSKKHNINLNLHWRENI